MIIAPPAIGIPEPRKKGKKGGRKKRGQPKKIAWSMQEITSFEIPEVLKKFTYYHKGKPTKKTLYEYTKQVIEKGKRGFGGKPIYLQVGPDVDPELWLRVQEKRARMESGKLKVTSENTKLGGTRSRKEKAELMILANTLPAGPAYTSKGVVNFCPGATGFCARGCYAKKGRQALPMQKSFYAAAGDLLVSNPKRYEEMIDKEIRRAKKKTKKLVFRVNVAGDLFSEEVIDMWARLAAKHPDVTFYAYTRSWRIPRLRERIEEKLMKLPNFVVLASTDPETGRPPKGWPEAGIGGSWTGVKAVCPETLAKATGREKVPSCADCGLCYSKERLKKTGGVVFVPH